MNDQQSLSPSSIRDIAMHASGGKGGSPRPPAPRPPNGPSTTGKPSGGGRGNNPPKG